MYVGLYRCTYISYGLFSSQYLTFSDLFYPITRTYVGTYANNWWRFALIILISLSNTWNINYPHTVINLSTSASSALENFHYSEKKVGHRASPIYSEKNHSDIAHKYSQFVFEHKKVKNNNQSTKSWWLNDNKFNKWIFSHTYSCTPILGTIIWYFQGIQ